MDELQEFVISKLAELHLKLYYRKPYSNSSGGAFERLKDTIECEQLKEVARMNPKWNIKDMGEELSTRIRNKTEF